MSIVKAARRAWLENITIPVLDNTRRARVAPKGLLCRVLTNHPAERQDTWVLDNYFQANLWSFPPRPSRGPVFGHLKHREPSQVYTKLVPIRIIFRFRDTGETEKRRTWRTQIFGGLYTIAPSGQLQNSTKSLYYVCSSVFLKSLGEFCYFTIH